MAALCSAAAGATLRRGGKQISSEQLQRNVWIGRLRAEGLDCVVEMEEEEEEEEKNLQGEKLWTRMKAAVARELDRYKGWRLNEIALSADLNKLALHYFSRGTIQAHFAELKAILASENLKGRYEQFNSLFKRMEDDSSQQQTRTSAGSSRLEQFTGLRWSDLMPRAPVCSAKYRTGPRLADSSLAQERRMKQVIDTYNHAVRVKWNSAGTRVRPLTADPKQSLSDSLTGFPIEPKRKNSSNSKLTVSRTSERESGNSSILSDDRGCYNTAQRREHHHVGVGSGSKNTSLLAQQQRSSKSGILSTAATITTSNNARNGVGSPKMELCQQRSLYQSFKTPVSNAGPSIRLTSTIPHHRPTRVRRVF